MNIAAYGHKFFLFGGAILIAVAGLQLLARPRPKGKMSPARLLDGTTIKAFFFVVIGILAILVGTGTIPMTVGR
ncbi:MAG TPA: hypothetical protein VIM14_05925 [Polyangia bacterium]